MRAEFEDPFGAWTAMMRVEKPGGHGERCVAIGSLDMALWDAAAKIAGLPLYAYLAHRVGAQPGGTPDIYAGGGYYYPQDDIARLTDEVRAMLDRGYTRVKPFLHFRPIRPQRRNHPRSSRHRLREICAVDGVPCRVIKA
jgi:L-alanine-DL-glutamate epimerase-like enolase superfamily enzyme